MSSRSRIKFIVAFTLAMALAVGLATPALAVTSGPVKSGGDRGHGLGLKPSNPDPKLKLQASRFKTMASLPDSADVTGYLPPVGDQGHQGSCAAWSSCYYYKTWWEKLKHAGDAGWDPADPQFGFSPSFMYNQINGGYDGGTDFQSAFGLLQEKGAVDIAQFPYDDADYTTQPDDTQTQAALQYRIPSPSGAFGYFFANDFAGGPFDNDIEPLKELLAGGKPLVLGIPIFDDFPDFGDNEKTEVYVSDYSSVNPVDWGDENEFLGGHGVILAGYNDNVNPEAPTPDEQGGFLMVNSWGTDWNYGGKVFLSYKFVKDWVVEAWSMVDDRDTMPGISAVTPASVGAGDSMTITGDNFGAYRRDARVAFEGGVSGKVAAWADSRINVIVPEGAQSGRLQVFDWYEEASNTQDVIIDPWASAWFLAEGATWPGFDEWVLLQNPNSSASNVQVTFMTPQGRRPGPSLSVPAASRTTIHVNEYVPNNDVSTSIAVTNGVNICAERAMYVNTRDGKWGAHDSIGCKGSAAVWYLAEGATWPGYDEWVLVLNPGDVPVTVKLTFQTPNGQAPGPDMTIPPGTRHTIHVNEYMPDRDVSTKVECTTPGKGIVVERAMYVNAGGKKGCYESIGLSELAAGWGLAEGATWPGFEEWVLVQNPTDIPAQVVFYFVTPDDFVSGPTISLDAGGRVSLRVNDYVTDADVSTMVLTEADNQKVAVERAMYMNTPDGKRDAHNAGASAVMSTWWYLPEGCTAPGYDEWILVMNPDPDKSSTVNINFMTPGGPVSGVKATLPPLTRATCHVNDFVKGDVSAEVRASSYVVCERAMYITAPDGKAGSTDSLAVLASMVNPEGTGGGSTPLSEHTISSLRARLGSATLGAHAAPTFR